MIVLIQRVTGAEVTIDGQQCAKTGYGILALVAIEKGDGDAVLRRTAERLLNYRIFPDENRKMNLSLRDIHGELLLVPQFTLAADTRKGNRPGFSAAASPEQGRILFGQFVAIVKSMHSATAQGRFGADMQVSLINDGPVTFWLRTPALPG